ncbi:hypothetical protein DPMN_034769 [Dreissena polymorpha]|uniref:Uncharacterized protein n=1 Tax=Dreissena polymorpha TaxID=45954 RepID=A0A9D4M850_DREPO|nr:hypothetical protein DPMN_034769 [Dreissena polymorpha]
MVPYWHTSDIRDYYMVPYWHTSDIRDYYSVISFLLDTFATYILPPSGHTAQDPTESYRIT